MCFQVQQSLFDASGVLVPWFHGQVSRDESHALLSGAGASAFLVRVSERQPECFTLSYTKQQDGRSVARNCLVYNVGPVRWRAVLQCRFVCQADTVLCDRGGSLLYGRQPHMIQCSPR